ncbi:hypothetical protein ElyMa_004679700 [Elysia marginata]|uniref:Uncharacterized protein n=1 Tax=Elysia marginata TaxID=1093978 RepID=A0AAV4I4W2_9GAST|nr:hypothetical protein ElyMa_004679700 [Elysia marginata]
MFQLQQFKAVKFWAITVPPIPTISGWKLFAVLRGLTLPSSNLQRILNGAKLLMQTPVDSPKVTVIFFQTSTCLRKHFYEPDGKSQTGKVRSDFKGKKVSWQHLPPLSPLVE